MKKMLLVLAVFGAMTMTAQATPYIQGNVIRSKLDVNNEIEVGRETNAAAYRAAVGNDVGVYRYALDVTNFGRIQEKNHHELGTDVDSVNANSLGLTGIVDLTQNAAFTPYVGARVGVNRVRFKNRDVSDTQKDVETTFGAGLVAGVQYRFNPNLAIDAGIEYNKLGQIDVKDVFGNKVGEIKPRQKGLNVGVRYNF